MAASPSPPEPGGGGAKGGGPGGLGGGRGCRCADNLRCRTLLERRCLEDLPDRDIPRTGRRCPLDVAGILSRDCPCHRGPDGEDRNHQDKAEPEHERVAHQRGGQVPPTDPKSLDELAGFALKPPVTQDGPDRPIGDHKIADSLAGQPQDMGVSLRDNSNNPCNVHGAFPPSLDERQPFWSVAKTRGRRLATTRRNGPSSTLTQAVGGAAIR